MSGDPINHEFDPQVERYLDGVMSPDERAAFEAKMGGAEALRAEIELQERVDQGLRHLFAYQPPMIKGEMGDDADANGSIAGRIETAETEDAKPATADRAWWAGSRGRFLAAAAVLLLAAGAFRIYIANANRQPPIFIEPEQVYAAVDKPEFVCTTDEEFAKAVKNRLGEPLVLAAAPGIEALGWAYGEENGYGGNIVGKKTLVLIMKVRGEKVLVLMDRKRDDRKLESPHGDTLKLFRGENGGLVLYEVTPFDKPEVIGLLHKPK